MNENGTKGAFPTYSKRLEDKIGRGISEGEYSSATSGLTKREYLAAMAMQGILSRRDMPITDLVETSVFIADSLLKQLSK